jgi:hypothetical protein
MTLSNVVAAAVAPCWTLATAWEYAALPGFIVGYLEFGRLHPVQQRVRRDAHRLGRLVDVALGQQRGHSGFHLPAEFGSVPFHSPIYRHHGLDCGGLPAWGRALRDHGNSSTRPNPAVSEEMD